MFAIDVDVWRWLRRSVARMMMEEIFGGGCRPVGLSFRERGEGSGSLFALLVLTPLPTMPSCIARSDMRIGKWLWAGAVEQRPQQSTRHTHVKDALGYSTITPSVVTA